ncbi:MAG TPA: DUF6186 family protein [Actinomycetota bacterium]|nr:DUF6186 family protein [Actinomycetota bacterium]
MSWEATAGGYLVILLAAAAVELAARSKGRWPTLGQAVAAVNRFRTGRALLLAAWLWAGWHLFVRASWG